MVFFGVRTSKVQRGGLSRFFIAGIERYLSHKRVETAYYKPKHMQIWLYILVCHHHAKRTG